MFYISKKGVVSLTIFSLSVLIMVLIVFFSYYYTDENKIRGEEDINSRILLNSVTSFRSHLVVLASQANSTFFYQNSLDPSSIYFNLNGNIISGVYDYGDSIIILNISTFGIMFCDSYNFSPSRGSDFEFNSSCVSMD